MATFARAPAQPFVAFHPPNTTVNTNVRGFRKGRTDDSKRMNDGVLMLRGQVRDGKREGAAVVQLAFKADIGVQQRGQLFGDV